MRPRQRPKQLSAMQSLFLQVFALLCASLARHNAPLDPAVNQQVRRHPSLVLDALPLCSSRSTPAAYSPARALSDDSCLRAPGMGSNP